MKRVRITIDPTDLQLRPLYHHLTGDDRIERTDIVNWNVSDPPAGFLFRIWGAYETLEGDLDGSPHVDDYEILPLTDRECYCFLKGEATPGSRALFENFTRGSLLTVPPVSLNPNGTSTFTLIGTQTDIQTAVERIPDPVGVTVDEVGGERVATDSVITSLSPRQREAIETALTIGYYDVPRGATVEGVADELECAPTTAAEHLQKAESKLITALFG
jgi:hypothetical protein